MTKKSSKLKRFFLILSILISVLFLTFIGFVTYFYTKYDLNINELTSFNNGIKVYSATGNDSTLYNTNRSIVDVDDLPDYVKNAFISIEDKNFYSHNGYDLKRIAKSFLVNLSTQSKTQGASTISQQLIKNALLTNEKTYSRKIKEIVLSIKMEKKFSKDEILKMYLNTIYFGSNAYGIENASKTYFNKSAKDLTINEACCLAGLIKSPNYYSPRNNYNKALERKNLVAKRMLINNKISKDDYESIVNSKIELSTSLDIDDSYEKEAIFEACQLLNINERDLINKKYQIITFKDDNLQNEIIKYNNEIIDTAESTTNSSLDSLSVVANNNGNILAYYSNSQYNLHNLKRQPASTLKPFAVYLPCFAYNILSPASLILDEEINYNGFKPNNADKTFHGNVSVRTALAQSLNIPAVKALDYLGIKKAKETLADFGINLSNGDLNLSLSLGAVQNGVNLLTLMNAYSTLANQGIHKPLCFVDKILDENNNLVYSYENFETRIASSEDCFLINDILTDCAKQGTAKRLNDLNIPIASKTGTASNSNGNTDLYNFAYTTEHTLMTWVADIDNSNLPATLLSSSVPTEINKDIASALYNDKKPLEFEKPNNVIKCGYDLIEYSNNILAQPNHKIERYIAYDYFKIDNLPPMLTKAEFDYNVSVDRTGALITFEANKLNTYKVFKRIKNEDILLETIKDNDESVIIKDSDIFAYDKIEYYILDSDNNLIGNNKTIKPKDYLINFFNNELLSSKKKWLV